VAEPECGNYPHRTSNQQCSVRDGDNSHNLETPLTGQLWTGSANETRKARLDMRDGYENQMKYQGDYSKCSKELVGIYRNATILL
jgi:hypothetical protein